jgi:hypothetical protein
MLKYSSMAGYVLSSVRPLRPNSALQCDHACVQNRALTLVFEYFNKQAHYEGFGITLGFVSRPKEVKAKLSSVMSAPVLGGR